VRCTSEGSGGSDRAWIEEIGAMVFVFLSDEDMVSEKGRERKGAVSGARERGYSARLYSR
jgi:hypothetical protein